MRTLDHKASHAIHRISLGRVDYIVALPGMLFGSYMMPLVVVGLGVLINWQFAAVLAMVAITTLAVTAPLKYWVGRDRPDPPEAPRALKLRKLVKNPAFPSGDSAQAGAVAVMLVLLGPLVWPLNLLWLALVPLCMFSRVYFGAHWWGDTVAGAAIGAAVGLAYVHWFGGWVQAAM
jgi:membrane-associated phospholipid phosphatase